MGATTLLATMQSLVLCCVAFTVDCCTFAKLHCISITQFSWFLCLFLLIRDQQTFLLGQKFIMSRQQQKHVRNETCTYKCFCIITWQQTFTQIAIDV